MHSAMCALYHINNHYCVFNPSNSSHYLFQGQLGGHNDWVFRTCPTSLPLPYLFFFLDLFVLLPLLPLLISLLDLPPNPRIGGLNLNFHKNIKEIRNEIPQKVHHLICNLPTTWLISEKSKCMIVLHYLYSHWGNIVSFLIFSLYTQKTII